jgi:hypothetical protein
VSESIEISSERRRTVSSSYVARHPNSPLVINMIRLARFALVLALVALSSPAYGQTAGFGVGPKLGFYLSGGAFAIGAVTEFPMTREVTIEPGLEFVVGIKDLTRIILDANVRYGFPLQGLSIEPWVLAGLGYRFDSYHFVSGNTSDSSPHLNLGGGVTFNARASLQPWAGLKIYLLDSKGGSDVLLQGGVNFYL